MFILLHDVLGILVLLYSLGLSLGQDPMQRKASIPVVLPVLGCLGPSVSRLVMGVL